MKLTPLNISVACILVWTITEWGNNDFSTMSIVGLLVLVVILALLDLLFRIFFKDLKKVWFLQIGFILLVGIVMIIIKTL